MQAPEPVYLRNMPAWVAKRADELYGMVRRGSVTMNVPEMGSVTIHRDEESVKFKVELYEAAKPPKD